MLAACPEAWASEIFIPRCRWLTALAASSERLAADLRAMPVGQLAAALTAHRRAYEMLQYLVATRQPQPWVESAECLLTKRGREWRMTKALRAYSGFEGWRKAMRGDGGAGGGDDESAGGIGAEDQSGCRAG